jgi:hypothetical protein
MSICRIWVTKMTKNVPILKNFIPYFRISKLKLGNVIINLKTKKSHKSTKYNTKNEEFSCKEMKKIW